MKKTKFRTDVITSWNHANAKFAPGATARVKARIRNESRVAKRYCGSEGCIVAVSSNGGFIRGNPAMGDVPRGWTRYYVAFGNGVTRAFYSQNLY